MISLGKHRNDGNSKSKRNGKSFNASLSKFQDFLNKTLTKSNRSTSKMLNPNKTQIERLNFSNTANSTSFLPPKSIDKYRLSSTNRGYITFKQEFSKMENLSKKERQTYFMEKQHQDSQLTRRQIKQKVENNAMHRFQQLFKKQTNIRTKIIEEQQSKRLICLLEHTSRRSRQNHPQQNLNRRSRPNIPVSKKSLKPQQSQTLQQHKNEVKKNQKYSFKQPNHKIKKTDNSKSLFQERQRQENEKEKKRLNGFQIKRKNSIVTQKESIQQLKEMINKPEQSNKIEEIKAAQMNEVAKQTKKTKQIEQIKKTAKNHDNLQFKQIIKVQDSHQQSFSQNQIVNEKKLQQEKLNQIKKINQSKKSINQLSINSKINQNNKINDLNSDQKLEVSNKEQQNQQINKKILTKNEPKKESFQQEFEIEELQTFDAHQGKKSQKNEVKLQFDKVQMRSNTSKKLESHNELSIVEKQRENQKQQKNDKVKIQVMNVQKMNGLANINNNKSVNNVIGLKSNKQSTTIKGTRDIKGKETEKGKQKMQTYGDEDLDVVEIGYKKEEIGKMKEQSNQKQKQNIKINQTKNNSTHKTVEVNQNKISSTSLADKVERMQGKVSMKEIPNEQNKSKESYIEKKQREQYDEQQQQQQQQLHPADELDYLICLVQNLGRYYNKSKQFYTHTESSMVEIVMNHKLAAYYTSQQFFYYLNIFIRRFENDQQITSKFYSLQYEELRQALQDETILEAIEDLKNSIQVAKKLIKHTHQKARVYLKKEEKELTINAINNYHQNCLSHVREQFQGLYTLYEQRKSNTLAERLCFLIEIYCIVKSLNQEETKYFQDLQDIGEENYHQHIIENQHLIRE